MSRESESPTALANPGSRRLDVVRFTPGTIVSDRYRIVSLLGSGGMGEIYRADDMKLGQRVALKFVPPELTAHASSFQQLCAEVRIGRQISHPNVCRIYDAGIFDRAAGPRFFEPRPGNEAHRPHLTNVAYRMLGSLAETEDAIQEAWLKVSRAEADEVENLGGRLTTVVARVRLNMLRGAPEAQSAARNPDRTERLSRWRHRIPRRVAPLRGFADSE